MWGKNKLVNKIEFIALDKYAFGVCPKPFPASQALPQWWKDASPYIKSKENPDGNLSNAGTPQGIIKALDYINNSRPEIKNIVIDDFQYMSSFEYFDRATEKGYDKFTQIASGLATVAKKPKDLREDLMVYFLTHAEESVDMDGKRRVKAKTIGK